MAVGESQLSSHAGPAFAAEVEVPLSWGPGNPWEEWRKELALLTLALLHKNGAEEPQLLYLFLPVP